MRQNRYDITAFRYYAKYSNMMFKIRDELRYLNVNVNGPV